MTNLLVKSFIKNNEDYKNSKVRGAYGKLAGTVGIISNIILFAIKFSVGMIFSSVSVVADAINNLSDGASSLITLIGFKLAGKPADEEHPFGHARIEYITGIIISFIILLIGWQLGVTSIEKISSPIQPDFGTAVYIALVVSIIIKIWQYAFNKKIGRLISSQTITATSFDSLNDAISTTAVLIAALVSQYANINLDGYMGIAVALFIVYSGVKLIIETSAPLLGEAPDEEFSKNIKDKILSYDGVLGVHDLMIHSYGGGKSYVTVDCEICASKDVMAAHDIVDEIERDFLEELGVHLVVHTDPIITGDKKTNELKEKIELLLSATFPELSLHDFRVVWGSEETKVLFDVNVPFSFKKSDKDISLSISKIVSALDKSYSAIVIIDRGN